MRSRYFTQPHIFAAIAALQVDYSGEEDSYKQRTGLYAGWVLELCLPGPLLIENILLKLKTNAQQCLSSPEPMHGFAVC